MTGFKSARMIVLSFVTLTEGVSIGYAQKLVQQTLGLP